MSQALSPTAEAAFDSLLVEIESAIDAGSRAGARALESDHMSGVIHALRRVERASRLKRRIRALRSQWAGLQIPPATIRANGGLAERPSPASSSSDAGSDQTRYALEWDARREQVEAEEAPPEDEFQDAISLVCSEENAQFEGLDENDCDIVRIPLFWDDLSSREREKLARFEGQVYQAYTLAIDDVPIETASRFPSEESDPGPDLDDIAPPKPPDLSAVATAEAKPIDAPLPVAPLEKLLKRKRKARAARKPRSQMWCARISCQFCSREIVVFQGAFRCRHCGFKQDWPPRQ